MNFNSIIKKFSNKRVRKRRNKIKKLILKGNKISQGSELTGVLSLKGKVLFEDYLTKISVLVRKNWILPSYLAERNLQCRIRIYLNKKGKLIRVKIYEKSGDKDFDQFAINSIKKTKFPALDDKFSAKGLKGEILLGFPL